MSTSAIIFMILGILITWGGLVFSILNAVHKSNKGT